MVYPPATLVDTYAVARAAVESKEITTVPLVSRMGAESMTKTCYKHETYGAWVYLVTTNKRILEAEVAQLVEFGKHMQTPYLGPESADKMVFECKKKGATAYAFLEMRFNGGYKEQKVKNDQGGQWFAREILDSLRTVAELKQVMKFLTDADSYLKQATSDIPDFQIAWDPVYGMLFLFDPGDPENWGSALDSHRKAITKWLWFASDSRLAKTIAKKEEVAALEAGGGEKYMCYACNSLLPTIEEFRKHRLNMHS